MTSFLGGRTALRFLGSALKHHLFPFRVWWPLSTFRSILEEVTPSSWEHVIQCVVILGSGVRRKSARSDSGGEEPGRAASWATCEAKPRM